MSALYDRLMSEQVGVFVSRPCQGCASLDDAPQGLRENGSTAVVPVCDDALNGLPSPEKEMSHDGLRIEP